MRVSHEGGFTWSYHITSHTCSTSASREQLNSPRCWVQPFGSFFWGYLFSVWVVCVHFILFIKLFLSVYCLNLCRATFAVWITKRTSLASVLLLDKESDALHKINYYIYKDTEHKYFGCYNMSSELLTVCCWAGNEGNRSSFRPWVKLRAVVSSVIVPAEHDSSSAWEPAPLRWKHNYRVVHLLVNYIGLMFNLYF